MTDSGPSHPDPEQLADRLDALQQTALRAGTSLETAHRAMTEIADLCDVDVPASPKADETEKAATAAARAEVSLEAAADELERIAAALRATAGARSEEDESTDKENDGR
jgi:hypothetical protein